MGLSTYTSANRITESPLVRTYERERVAYSGGYYYLYTRRTTKRFKYVGLSKTAAAQCQSAMEARYRRWIIAWKLDSVNFRIVPEATRYPMQTEQPLTPEWYAGRVPTQCANVTCTNEGPDLYDVSVELNEEVPIANGDSALSDAYVENLFTTYYGNAWSYDED